MRQFTNKKTYLVISTDTDAVVLAISMLGKREKDRLLIAFGKVKDLRWISIHGVSISLGLDEICVHVFIGFHRMLIFRAKHLMSLVTWTWNLLTHF